MGTGLGLLPEVVVAGDIAHKRASLGRPGHDHYNVCCLAQRQVDFAGIERIRFSAEEEDRRQLARAFAPEERIGKFAPRAAPQGPTGVQNLAFLRRFRGSHCCKGNRINET